MNGYESEVAEYFGPNVYFLPVTATHTITNHARIVMIEAYRYSGPWIINNTLGRLINLRSLILEVSLNKGIKDRIVLFFLTVITC